MLATMGLLPWTASVTADEMSFDGRDLRDLSGKDRRRIIGKDLAMIFQEPMSSLNPCFTVGFQIREALKQHMDLDRKARQARAAELFEMVGIPDPERHLRAFPHQLSGGMNQRVMIAMAIACRPRLLIADEPTTALDVTIQAQILDLLTDLQRETGMGLILITHDMGVVAETAERVAVQCAGQKVEEQPVANLFARPHHPLYRRPASGAAGAGDDAAAPDDPGRGPRTARPSGGLPFLAALPVRRRSLPRRAPAGAAAPRGPRALPLPAGRSGRGRRGARVSEAVVRAEGLGRDYAVGGGLFSKPGIVRAVAGTSFEIEAGKTLAVVGESGCGKSTLARMVTLIEEPTSGTLSIAGKAATPDAWRALRTDVQIVFQDPYGSLDLRQRVGAILGEPLKINRPEMSAAERRNKAREMMRLVGLREEYSDRYPHMFSGGQRQRIAVARADAGAEAACAGRTGLGAGFVDPESRS